MQRKPLFYIIFFILLITGFYITVRRWIKPNNTISVVQPFSFVNQDGQRITNKDVEGKVYVAEFFFTSCKGICPKMNNNLKEVYSKYKGEKNFLILSHTCDPQTDSVLILKKYSDSLQVNTKQWIFLTGRKDSLYNAARLSYSIDDPANNLKKSDDDFLHSQFWALVDKEGKVKKIYDSLKESEVRALIIEIGKLLKQE